MSRPQYSGRCLTGGGLGSQPLRYVSSYSPTIRTPTVSGNPISHQHMLSHSFPAFVAQYVCLVSYWLLRCKTNTKTHAQRPSSETAETSCYLLCLGMLFCVDILCLLPWRSWHCSMPLTTTATLLLHTHSSDCFTGNRMSIGSSVALCC